MPSIFGSSTAGIIPPPRLPRWSDKAGMIVPRAGNGSSVLALPIHRRANYPVKIIPRCLHLILTEASGWRHLPSSKCQRPNVVVNDFKKALMQN